MNTLTDLLLGVGQPRVSHFPDLCTLLYTYLSTLDYWTKIVYYLFTQTSPVAHTSALTPTYIKSQKLPNWPISKELGLGRMLLPHWKLLFWLLTKIIKHLKIECWHLWIDCNVYLHTTMVFPNLFTCAPKSFDAGLTHWTLGDVTVTHLKIPPVLWITQIHGSPTAPPMVENWVAQIISWLSVLFDLSLKHKICMFSV